MSEQKHTPGPWRYESTSGSNYARIFFSADEKDGDNLRGYCGEANARLIAAAPELLEALQFLMVASGEKLTTAFEQAQEAIAKATKGQE